MSRATLDFVPSQATDLVLVAAEFDLCSAHFAAEQLLILLSFLDDVVFLRTVHQEELLQNHGSFKLQLLSLMEFLENPAAEVRTKLCMLIIGPSGVSGPNAIAIIGKLVSLGTRARRL